MNKSRFTLAAIITLLGALSFGFVSYMGSIYLNSGKLLESAIYPAISAVLLALFALIAANFKKARFNFKKNSFKELFFILLYLVTAFFSIVNFTHFFTVQDQKSEIASKIKVDIDNTKEMFDKYEERVSDRIAAFDGFLDIVIEGKSADSTMYLKYFDPSGPPIDKQKNNKLMLYEDDLKPAKYDTMKAQALDWLKNSEKKVLDIKPFGLMEVIDDFEENAEKWKVRIQEFDKVKNTFPDEEKIEKFKYNLSFNSVSEELSKIKKPNLLAIILLIVAHFLILAVYFLAIRDGKSPGLIKSLLKKERTTQGDL